MAKVNSTRSRPISGTDVIFQWKDSQAVEGWEITGGETVIIDPRRLPRDGDLVVMAEPGAQVGRVRKLRFGRRLCFLQVERAEFRRSLRGTVCFIGAAR